MQTDIAKIILDDAANPRGKYCEWCRHPDKRIRRAGLCNHCYRLKLQVKRCEQDLANVVPSADDRSIRVLEQYLCERRLKVARRTVELAKAEGESYARFARDVSGIAIEHQFSYVSRTWLRTDLFHGWASIFDGIFDETQRRFLFYVLRNLVVEHLRQNRRRIAEATILASERERG